MAKISNSSSLLSEFKDLRGLNPGTFFLIWLQDQNSISSPFCRIIGSAFYPSTAVAHPETSERY